MQKGIALATCMAIVMGLFTGCGNKNDQQIAASPDEVQKGRYVETELSLPEEWKDKNISQIFRSGDELHFLVAGGAEGQVSLEEWMLGEGDTLTEVTKDWLKALPEGKGLESSDSFTLLQDAEGNQYLYGNCYRDEESSSAHLWKEADGSALDITPQKWLEPMDMDGYRFYDTPQYVTLTEDELLVGLSYFSLDVVLAQDGSLVSSQESDSLTDSGSLSDNKWVSAVGDTLYLAQTDEQGNVNGLLQMQLDGSNGQKRRKCFLFPGQLQLCLFQCAGRRHSLCGGCRRILPLRRRRYQLAEAASGNRYRFFSVGSVVQGYCGAVGRQCIRVVWK